MRVHYFQIFRTWDKRWGYDKMYTLDKYLSGFSDIVYFRVEAYRPEIRFLSTRKTYEASVVPLSFTVNKPILWQGCSLDGKAVVEVTDDVRLPNGLVWTVIGWC
jgi:hypothetical protein